MTTISRNDINRFLPLDGTALSDNEIALVHGLSSQIVQPADTEPAAIRMINKMIKENRVLQEPRHGVIVGDAGCGKTTLMDILRSQEPVRREEFQLGIRHKIPLLTTSLPSNITPRSMAQEMLREIGDTGYLTGTAFSLTDKLIRHIKTCEVELVVIDEFQHLLALGRGSIQGSSRRLVEARNWIKTMINKTGVTFLLMGVPETLALLDGDDQLERRFTHVLEIEPLGPPSPTNSEFIDFVDALLYYCVSSFDFFDDADFLRNSPTDAFKMYIATAGVPSRIKDLLITATLLAYRKNSKCISAVHFTAAFTSLHEPLARAFSSNKRRESRKLLLDSLDQNAINPFAEKDSAIQQLIQQLAAEAPRHAPFYP